ncbi:J domain-containing protein [Clostridium sp.]|uniref:J domain-containing protein n=1 Tax=Clostridium sp. TaxID=1506 RepID=UPI00262AC9E3|nr:J domain-containing protein [Clostridium sp.]
MNWWDILEIPYDSDIKTIKKAYSKLLKINNPEDNPKSYQRLREAYDAAIKYVKKNNKNQGNQEKINNNLDKNIINEVDVCEVKDYISESYINKDKQIIFKPELDINENCHNAKLAKVNLYNQITQFLNRLKDIYHDLSLRSDPEVWEELLNSAVIWNVEAFPIIEEEIFNFLTKHKYLPAEVWLKLNNNFTWSQNEIKLYNKYSAFIVDEFFENLKKPSKLRYDYIKSINPEIADEYLYEREQAEKALKAKKYANAYNHLKKANSLFEGDAELSRLKGDYHYDLEHLETAYDYYKSAFEINNNDLSSALHIGIILVSFKEFGEAIPYLKKYLFYSNNNDKLALRHLAYCYYYNNDLISARENFQKLLYFDENNKTIKKYLKNIEAQLVGKHVRKILFDKDTLVKEEVAKEKNVVKKLTIKERIRVNKILIIKQLSKIIILYVMFYGLRHLTIVKNPTNYNNTKSNITYENKSKENKNDENKNKEALKNFEKSILDPKNNHNIGMDLNNVKATKYYKISQPFENRSIFSDIELEEKRLRDKVESQLYVGSTKVNVVIFADPKCSDKTIDENGKYMIHGVVCPIDEEIVNKIMDELAPDYQGFDWISNGFIDASQTAINSKK